MFVKMCIALLRARLLNDLKVLDHIPSTAPLRREVHDSSFAVICTGEQTDHHMALSPCSQLPNSATLPCHQLPDAKSATPKSISVLPLTHTSKQDDNNNDLMFPTEQRLQGCTDDPVLSSSLAINSCPDATLYRNYCKGAFK